MTDLPISKWLEDHSSLFQPDDKVLDLACGSGRHSIFLAQKGCAVTAVDIDTAAIRSLGLSELNIIDADLEQGNWPFEVNTFDAILVSNYLWRLCCWVKSWTHA